MKKIYGVFLLLIFLSGYSQFVFAEPQKVLTGFVEAVPVSFYGTWRVSSRLVSSDNSGKFKDSGLDIWNLSRMDNVITLCNVFNGAKAELKIDKADSNYIVFTKSAKYGTDKLTDTVEIFIEGDTFKGIDTIHIETYNQIKYTARYRISGERISGEIK